MSDVYQVKAHSKGTASTTLSSCPNEGGKRSLQIVEGHWIPFQVPTCIAMPPKHPVASVIGFRKRKSAIAIMRLSGKERNFSGEPFSLQGTRVHRVHGRVRTGAGAPIDPQAGCRGGNVTDHSEA